VTCDECILLVCENGNFWGFPKGRIEHAETPLDAAKREIIEETGCREFTFAGKLGTYKRHPFTLQNTLDTSEIKEIRMFLFTAPSQKLHDHSELNIEGHWVTKQAVTELLTHPEDRAFYESIGDRL